MQMKDDMKVTIEFDEVSEAKKAIHAQQAWMALAEISELLRSQRKHDIPETQTLACIQEVMQDVMPYLYE